LNGSSFDPAGAPSYLGGFDERNEGSIFDRRKGVSFTGRRHRTAPRRACRDEDD
jgi:hypothetical protein